MLNIRTHHQEVIDAFMAKVRAGVLDAGGQPLFNTTNLWLSDDPTRLPERSRHRLTGIVCPADGSFGEPEFDGGGRENIIEYTAVTIVIHSALRTAQAEKPAVVLTDPAIGLWVIKRKILRALAGQWLTKTVDGQPYSLLIQPVQPLHSDRPTIQGQPVGDLAISFSLPFEWDLT